MTKYDAWREALPPATLFLCPFLKACHINVDCALAGIYAFRRRYYCPFFLIRKGERIKADIKGPSHKAGAPPPCRPWPARPTRARFDKPSESFTIAYAKLVHSTWVAHAFYVNSICLPPGSRMREQVFRTYCRTSSRPQAYFRIYYI